MRALVGYGLAGAVVAFGGAAALARWVVPGAASPVWFAAVVAYAIQLPAFALLLAGGRRGRFLAAWAAGMAVRACAVVGVGVWVLRGGAQAPVPLLVSLVGFLFVLLLLEPVFYRIGPVRAGGAAGGGSKGARPGAGRRARRE